MSLQVQSSQPAAPSGRRTPQVYQVPVQNSPAPSASSATPPTNGNSNANNKSSTASKLSLKGSSGKSSPASSGKASPAPTTAPVVAVTPQKVVVVDLVDDEKTSSPVKPVAATPEKVEKEVTNGSAKEATNGKHEEVKESPKKEVKSSPKATPQKSIPVEQVKTPETVSPKKKETKEAAPEPEAKKKVDASLVAEKTLKGFTAEGDEMESLVVEPSEYEDSPMPPRTGGKSKLLKGGPPTRARISPFRVAQEAATAANASTVVNLSTVSEGQNSESNEASPAVDFNRPLRAISGRRSTRPLTEIQFSYRKPTAVDPNDSSSSLNVTVGSEIHNDSLRTPAGPGSSRKRKAMTPESTSDALDVKETIDSPKRTRLDFSGFLGIVASPVTMLKNRLSRVRLHASTPVAKRSFESEEDLVGKVVTAEATTTTANISGGTPDQKMDVDSDKKPDQPEEAKSDETTLTEGQTDVPADAAPTASEDASTAEEAKETDTVEVKDVTDKQRRCVIM